MHAICAAQHTSSPLTTEFITERSSTTNTGRRRHFCSTPGGTASTTTPPSASSATARHELTPSSVDMTSVAFSTVDLDAVLDDFENAEAEEQKTKDSLIKATSQQRQGKTDDERPDVQADDKVGHASGEDLEEAFRSADISHGNTECDNHKSETDAEICSDSASHRASDEDDCVESGLESGLESGPTSPTNVVMSNEVPPDLNTDLTVPALDAVGAESHEKGEADGVAPSVSCGQPCQSHVVVQTEVVEERNASDLTTPEPDTTSPTSDSRSASPPFESIYDTVAAAGNPPPYSEVDPMCASSGAFRDTASSVTINHEERSPSEDGGVSDWRQALLSNFTEDELMLGKLTPKWVPDTEASACMICDLRFTLVKRRHHCRACGRVLCSGCCSERAYLPCMEYKHVRVCKPCKVTLDRLQELERAQMSSVDDDRGHDGASDRPSRPQRPEMPEASSVPVGVLKRCSGTPSAHSTSEAATHEVRGAEAKQVMFSDGIRPGGDLTDLDGSSLHSRGASSISGIRRRRGRRGQRSTSDVGKSLIPREEGALPPFMGEVTKRRPDEVADIMRDSPDQGVAFQVNKNLRVHVKLLPYAPVSHDLWSYRSDGLSSVGQDEVVFLLVRGDEEFHVHKDVLGYFQGLYEQAKSGQPVLALGYSSLVLGKQFLGSNDYGGFLYIRHTFQSVEGLDLPQQSPYLFAIMLSKWEMPWARVFPLRLKLRLGAEMRYYPCPLWSVRDRKPVYQHIGNTILKLLCDFNNFTYSVPIIHGLLIHMELKMTTISIPKDRHRQILRALLNSNEPVLALGASFSVTADSHLVAVQNLDNTTDNGVAAGLSDYETQAINIMNKPRKVTGASFVVFNGALKTTTGLTAKSSIVEDGIMVQVTQDKMSEIRKSLEKMEDFEIRCGPVGAEMPDETVRVNWVSQNTALNHGVVSLIDGACLGGLSSFRLHSGRDFVSDEDCNLFVRWTEAFVFRDDDGPELDSPDPMAVASSLARAICSALVKHLRQLRDDGMAKIAVRVTVGSEEAGYDTGSQLKPEVLNSLDTVLIPLIHGEVVSRRLCLELIFHILNL